MGIYFFVSVVIIVACIFQIMIVLVQNSKGGGLASNFTSAGQSMGVRKTADFLEKATWTLAGAILILSIVATASIPRGETQKDSVIRNAIENTQDYTVPAIPSPAPQEEKPGE